MKRTQAKRKHVGQRPAHVKHEMELAHHEAQPPPARSLAKRRIHRPAKHQKRDSVKDSQHSANNNLRGAKADEGDQRLARPGEYHGADKGAGHGAGEGEVVVGGGEGGARVPARGRAVDEDVMGGLQVERLLDLCVRRDEQVDQRRDEEQGVETQVCCAWLASGLEDFDSFACEATQGVWRHDDGAAESGGAPCVVTAQFTDELRMQLQVK